MTSALQLPVRSSSLSVADSGATEVSKASVTLPAKAATTESKKLGDAARQFEAVFLRQILSSVGRAASVQGGNEAGSNLYGSMLVDAVADSVSRSGGMGLASMLVHSLEPQLQGSSTSPHAAANASNVDSNVSTKLLNTHSSPRATEGPQGPPPESGEAR